METFAILVQVADSAVRLSALLIFASLAGLFSERSGVFDIGLEGKMLGAAFAAAAAAAATGSAWIGLLAGIGASVFLAIIHALASITFRGNQIISGVAINFLASGLTVLISQAWYQKGGTTPALQGSARFNEIVLPFADTIKDVPIIGLLYSELLSGHRILVYVAFAFVPLAWFILYRTRFGLRLRAVGENPDAVDTAGISVVWLRYRAVIIAGILCGFGGAYLSIAQSSFFGREMTAGKGFIALAALIFARWLPWNLLWACLLFGLLEAIAIRFQSIQIPGVGEIPVQFMQATPYILTVVLLAGFVGKAIPPKAGGRPYVKER